MGLRSFFILLHHGVHEQAAGLRKAQPTAAVLNHRFQNPERDHNIVALSSERMPVGHHDDLLPHVFSGKLTQKQRRCPLSQRAAVPVVQETEDRRDANSKRHERNQGDPLGDPGEKAVKIVPSAVLRPKNFNHEIIDHCVKQYRDRGDQRFPPGNDMVFDEEAERDDCENRTKAVEKEAGACKNQHEAFYRSQNKQRNDKGERHGRDPREQQIHRPARHIEVLRSQAVDRIRQCLQHPHTAQDV